MANLGAAALLLGAGAWLLLDEPKKKRKTSSKDLPPPEGCGLYPWKPQEADEVLTMLIESGIRELDVLALEAARQVYPTTPEGEPQAWPAPEGDARANCILGRIKIRANLLLAQWADEEADDPIEEPKPAPTCPEGERYSKPLGRCVPERPSPPPVPPKPTSEGPGGFKVPEIPPEPPFPSDEPDPEPEWPDYPPEAPVDLAKWWPEENYPTPGQFHQIGGPNSGTTLKAIARKALTTAFYLVHDDLELAERLARRSENWRAYRDAINCCPWNHALYGSANEPDTPYYYDTPHGQHISLYPVHGDNARRLMEGLAPERRASEDDPSRPSGGVHAFLWLPPLDEAELLEERVKIKHEHWYTGDWVIMPPPEVLTLGVVDVPPGRQWGCMGYETVYEFDGGEEEAE